MEAIASRLEALNPLPFFNLLRAQVKASTGSSAEACFFRRLFREGWSRKKVENTCLVSHYVLGCFSCTGWPQDFINIHNLSRLPAPPGAPTGIQEIRSQRLFSRTWFLKICDSVLGRWSLYFFPYPQAKMEPSTGVSQVGEVLSLYICPSRVWLRWGKFTWLRKIQLYRVLVLHGKNSI